MIEGFADLFPPAMREHVLVGLDEPDDAAVYRVDAERALVFTADYFPPVVDDPRAYGAIAATNALNDVFAMGGKPFLALNLACFPDDMPPEVAREILHGAAAKALEAGAVVAGGHTTRGDEPTFGLAVIGFVHPERVVRKGGARPGDRLFVTKRLGTGVVTTAGKQGAASAEEIAAAIESMSQLNAAAGSAARDAGVRAGTDVTGFGLVGHALEMAEAGRCRFVIRVEDVPLLPGALAHARAGRFPGGAATNEDYFGARVRAPRELPAVVRGLMFSPETAGGLLVAVPAEAAAGFRDACQAWEIGHVEAGDGLELAV
jgi:selenide,water dikinase